MNLLEMQSEEMYVMVAPDGNPQLATLASDFAMCVAVIKMLHQKGISKSYHEMVVTGEYQILPVKVTIVANGTEEMGFQKDTSVKPAAYAVAERPNLKTRKD